MTLKCPKSFFIPLNKIFFKNLIEFKVLNKVGYKRTNTQTKQLNLIENLEKICHEIYKKYKK